MATNESNKVHSHSNEKDKIQELLNIVLKRKNEFKEEELIIISFSFLISTSILTITVFLITLLYNISMGFLVFVLFSFYDFSSLLKKNPMPIFTH